jgi:hypothetical protein
MRSSTCDEPARPMKRKVKWTEEEVLAAIRSYVAERGIVPAATDFHPGDCVRSARISAARSQAWLERADHARENVYPWPATVAKLFGSWSAAVRAAGFTPRRESVPDLKPAIKPSDAIRSIEGYLTRAKQSEDVDERRELLSMIADRALAALEE